MTANQSNFTQQAFIDLISQSKDLASTTLIKQTSHEKNAQLSLKLDGFEAALTQYINSRNKDYNEIKEKIQTTQEMAHIKKEEFRNQLDAKIDEIKQRQKALNIMMSAEWDKKIESERKIKNGVEDKMGETAVQISEQRKLSKNTFFGFENRFETSFKKVREKIDKLKEKNNANKNTLQTKKEDFFETVESELNREIQKKETSEAAIFDLLKSILQNINKQIEEEKMGRESSVEKILNLLEETCEKIEFASK